MIKAVEDKVILQPIKETETTLSSGFVVTGTQETPQEALVVSVGNGVTTRSGVHVPIPLNVGDKVVFAKYGGQEVAVNGENYIVIGYNDILAVIDG